MAVKRTLTQADMVLVSLYKASNGEPSKVPYEEIVLLAWKTYPKSFGLRNHPEYPDSSDIHKRLYQTLVPNGYAVSLGQKVFRLTEKGQARAARLLGIEATNSDGDAQGRLARNEDLFVRHARNTRAYHLWRAGKKRELVDYDARLFFQFGATTPYAERKRKLQFCREALIHANDLEVEDASELLSLCYYLSETFAKLFDE